jgi:glutaminyl-peptide cyclotransferase
MHVEDRFTDNTPHGEIAFNNIIVTKDTNAHQKLVLAAHFDSKFFENFDFIGNAAVGPTL